jgi:hypothetical protein
MHNITIVTVNWYSVEYIEKLLANLHGKAARLEKLKVLVMDNTNGSDLTTGRLSEASILCKIYPLNSGKLSGSRAHAFALNQAMKMLDTEFALIVDPDIHVFKNYWDTFFVNEIQHNDTVAIGAPFPPWKVGKYHDFPSPPFCFFRTEAIKNMSSDWTAFPKNPARLVGKFMVRQIGRIGPFITRQTYTGYSLIRKYSTATEKVLGVFAPDTGWLIAEEARLKNMKAILFDTTASHETWLVHKSVVPAFRDLAAYYELFSYKGELMVTHKYGSGGWPWKTRYGSDEAYWRKCIKIIEETSA